MTYEDERAALLATWAKILRRTYRDDNGCWVCTYATTSGGYARVKHRGRVVRAHRVAYAVSRELSLTALSKQYRQDRAVIDHWRDAGCRDTRCVNPRHLRLISDALNSRIGKPNAWQQNAARVHCPRGHALIGANLRPGELRRGKRACLTCDRARKRARHAKNRDETLGLSDAIAGVLAEPEWADMRDAALSDPGERELAKVLSDHYTQAA